MFIEFSVWNPALNVMSVVKLVFERTLLGDIIPHDTFIKTHQVKHAQNTMSNISMDGAFSVSLGHMANFSLSIVSMVLSTAKPCQPQNKLQTCLAFANVDLKLLFIIIPHKTNTSVLFWLKSTEHCVTLNSSTLLYLTLTYIILFYLTLYYFTLLHLTLLATR